MRKTSLAHAEKSYLGGFLILPAATIVFIAMIIPLGYALIMSMFDYKMGHELSGQFIFLDNYIRFFKDKMAISSLIITIIFATSALSLELIIGTLIAVMLMSIPKKLAGFFRTIYAMPLLISPIIIGLIWRYMYDPNYGIVYYFLSLVGLDQYFGGLGKPGWALFSTIIVDIWQTTPFVILVVTSGLTSISHDLYEAAKIDGAGAARILFKITLPLLTRVLIIITIIRGMDAFRVFDIIFAMTNGGPANSTLSLSIYAFKQGFNNYEMGYGITISLIMMFILVIVFTPLMKKFNEE